MGDFSTPLQLVINIERNLSKRKFLEELVQTDELYQIWLEKGYRFLVEVVDETLDIKHLIDSEFLIPSSLEGNRLYLCSATEKVLRHELSRFNPEQISSFYIEERGYLRLHRMCFQAKDDQ